MITQEEINNLNPGIYRFFWTSGGSSIVAVGINREGDRWLAPLNWSYPSDIECISDGQVSSYTKIIDKQGDEIDKYDKIQLLLNRSQDIINDLQTRSFNNKRKNKRDMYFLGITFCALGLLCLAGIYIFAL